MPEALIVGGPNGAGKSTFATEYLQDRDLRYLSADRIATELNPEAPEEVKIQAGKTFLRRLNRAIEEGKDLVVESTLAGKGIGRMMETLQESGYAAEIVFIFLDSPDTCVQRVRERVQRGGHHVPRSDIVRRFDRSIVNFWETYRYLSDQWYLFSNAEDAFQEVAFGEMQRYAVTDDHHFEVFRTILRNADV